MDQLFDDTFPVLPYNGTSGWSGSETSRARAAWSDSSGATSVRQKIVVAHLEEAGAAGYTWKQLSRITGLHHGAISGVLSALHKQGIICRLTETLHRCQVYVLPQHVNGREEAPYKPNAQSARMRELIYAVNEDLTWGNYEQAKQRIDEFLSE